MPRVPLPRPSMQTGYARSPGESEHPELWRGLVGAWVPGMQGGGNKLFDLSYYDAVGSFNGTPVWTVGDLGRALDFSGTGNYLDFGNPSQLQLAGGTSKPISYHIWLFAPTRYTGGGNRFLLRKVNAFSSALTNFNRFEVHLWGFGVINTGTDNFGNDEWFLVSFFSDGSTEQEVALNGISEASNTGTASGNQGASVTFANANFDIKLGGMFIYNVRQDIGEAQIHYANPYAPFVPRRRIYAVSVPAAGTSVPASLLRPKTRQYATLITR